jgi:hypothetical protein
MWGGGALLCTVDMGPGLGTEQDGVVCSHSSQIYRSDLNKETRETGAETWL